MKLKSIRIKDFRRFTDLTVQGVPDTAKLIILAGPNGCGKSSLFDAVNTWHGWTSKKYRNWEVDYHSKLSSGHQNNWNNNVQIEVFGSFPDEMRKAVYIRSAYRNDPEFQISDLQRVGDPYADIRVSRMVDNDAAVAKNFQRLVSHAIEEAFTPQDGTVTLTVFKEYIIGDIRDSFAKLFPDVLLDSLGNPLEDGTFRFTKGVSEGFAFKNLSGGEKAVFDLILDLVVARRSYDDTLFCIDEPESHMNAKLQAELLSVLYDLIPDNCQLMLATHSIGIMRRARDIEAAEPGSVVFLEFGSRDFDVSQVIEPEKPARTFWKKAHQVALDDLAALVAPERVVICEGHPKTVKIVRNHSQDARCYESIFEAEFPETRFVSMGNDGQVSGDRHGLAQALLSLVDGLEVVRLLDRDDRSDKEIADALKNDVRVLSRRNLESCLFDDEVLEALAACAGKADKTRELVTQKGAILSARHGDPPDDLKPASGEIYVACKGILGLTQCGNTAQAFMRDTLAPLVRPGMSMYEQLKRDIFGADPDG